MFISRCQPLHDSGHLYWGHPHFTFRDNEAMALNLILFKLALLQSEVEFALAKPFHHLPDYPLVFCPGLGEDQDVIQVYTDHPFHDDVTEGVIHHFLEGGLLVSLKNMTSGSKSP